jgi:hypothetical protein
MKQASWSAAEPRVPSWSLSTLSMLAFPLLIIISGLTYLWRRQERNSMGRMGNMDGSSTPISMMTLNPPTFNGSHANLRTTRMAVGDETLNASLPGPVCTAFEKSSVTEALTREDDMQTVVATESAVHAHSSSHIPHFVRRGPDAAYSRAPAPVMFKGMSKWKLPSLSDTMKKREAAAKFGGKKTRCYYWHIFWLGPQGRARAAPDWRVPRDRCRTRHG